MKTLLVSAILLVTAPSIWGATASFDSDTAGKPPAGWTCGATGNGKSCIWTKADSVTLFDDFNTDAAP